MRRAVIIGLSVLLIALQPQRAAALSETACGNLDTRFDLGTEFDSIACRTGGIGGGDGTASIELIQASGPRSVIIVEYFKAGMRSYIERLDPKGSLEESGAFAKTDDWSDKYRRGNVELRHFTGLFESMPRSVPCFSFTRVAGHVASTTGYRHMLHGFYCDFLGTKAIADDRIDDLMDAIELAF